MNGWRSRSWGKPENTRSIVGMLFEQAISLHATKRKERSWVKAPLFSIKELWNEMRNEWLWRTRKQMKVWTFSIHYFFFPLPFSKLSALFFFCCCGRAERPKQGGRGRNKKRTPIVTTLLIFSEAFSSAFWGSISVFLSPPAPFRAPLSILLLHHHRFSLVSPLPSYLCFLGQWSQGPHMFI